MNSNIPTATPTAILTATPTETNSNIPTATDSDASRVKIMKNVWMPRSYLRDSFLTKDKSIRYPDVDFDKDNRFLLDDIPDAKLTTKVIDNLVAVETAKPRSGAYDVLVGMEGWGKTSSIRMIIDQIKKDASIKNLYTIPITFN